MTLDPVVLSRLQFAWVVAWHILLPALTVGLASYIALLEGIWFVTGKEIWFRISSFWTRIFAVAFGMGVVSGVVMPFQFGTNWSRFSDATANIISPMLAYEGLTAFTLEAGFLGVMLFGRNLVPRWAHFASAVLVAAGTLLSTFWILVTNSWMQTPAGYRLVDGIFHPTSWSEIIFSASFPYRFAHTVVGFYVTTGFVVLGVAALLLRRQNSADEAKRMLSMTLWLLTLLVPLQIFLGDLHGLNTLHTQPAKLAAIEAHWEHEARAPLALFALPDEQGETNRYTIEVPLLGSLILTHDVNGVVPGLKDFPRQDRAPVAIPFFAFRIMVGAGLVMLALVALGLWLRLRRKLYDTGWFLRALTWSMWLGFLAVLAGWTTTEVGRQPWTVYGVMRTVHSVTPSLTGLDVLLSLLGYMVVYLIMFPTGLWFIAHIVRGGVAAEESSPVEGGRPAAPVKPVPGSVTMIIFDFVPIWTLILGLAVFFYVLLDGFDLGVGILYNFARTPADRNVLMNSIAPIWDGNETWLVLGGIGLLAAFPLAFAIILPAVYFPILVMLLALIFRGVAFEFRFRDAEHRTFWDHAFSFGSAIATFAQGVVLGAFIQGFQVEGRHFTGGSFDCFTPFSLFTGLALLCGYGLLGAGWLILKTEGALQAASRRQARFCFLATLAAVGIVSLWTPLMDKDIAQRWFDWPNIAFLAPVPVLTALFGILEWRAIADPKSELSPFLYAVLLFSLSYLGIAISLFPMIVPHHYSLWQAASSPDTQIFLGVGTLFLLPVILVYTGWSYWVFRGKVRADTGYH